MTSSRTFVPAGITFIIVSALIAIVVIMGSGSKQAPNDPESFAAKVDLNPLGTLAVNTSGRLKSLDSLANAAMHDVSGSRLIDGQSRTFTYFDMMIREPSYRTRPVIFVRKKLLRERIAAALLGPRPAEADAATRALANEFVGSGMVSLDLLRQPGVQREINLMRRDVRTTAKWVDELDRAMTRMNPNVLAGALRVVPPPTGEKTDRWLTLDEFAFADATQIPGLDTDRQQAVAGAWTDLVRGWRDEDAQRVNDAIVRLSNVVPTVNTSLYPAPQRTGWPWSFTSETLGGWIASAGLIIALIGLMVGFGTSGHQKWIPVTATVTWMLLAMHAFGFFLARYSHLELESFYFRNFHWSTAIWIVYFVSMVLLVMALAYRWHGAHIAGLTVFAMAFALQTAGLMLRWYISDRWPNSNMFEAVTTAAWMGGAIALPLEVVVRGTVMRGLFALGSAVSSMTALMAAHFLPDYLDADINNRMPVLHDIWLYIHTNVIIFSYVLIAMAAVVALLYLARRLILSLRGESGIDEFARVGGAGSLVMTRNDGTTYLASAKTTIGQVFDGATMILIELSFVLLWAGIVMGAMWADHSWGRPWGWDPKEVFALNTFLVFAVLVHVRLKVRDKGLWTSLLVLAGCVVMLFNWIFINFKISGLHSYA